MSAQATEASLRTGLLVGGQWRDASDGARFDVTDPATDTVIASVARTARP